MTVDARDIYRTRTAGRGADFRITASADVFGDAAVAAAVAGRQSLIVTTPTVWRLYGGGIARLGREVKAPVVVLNLSEKDKTIELVQDVCRAAVDLQLGRRDLLVAIGGGVCLDVVTMAASLYRRGIPHLRIPTTVVGQVDAGIGAKGAVNFNGSKNALGCFHPPEQVFIDRRLLVSLPAQAVRAGLAEVVKMAVVTDAGLFGLLEEHGRALIESRFQRPGGMADLVLERAIGLMSDELADNLFEDRGLQRKVDAGHTFSPKIEARSGFRVSHGEAVAVDLAFSASLACELGSLDEREGRRIIDLIAALGLPLTSKYLDQRLCLEAVAEAARHRGGRANLPVPATIGRVRFLSGEDGLDDCLLSRALPRHADACGRSS